MKGNMKITPLRVFISVDIVIIFLLYISPLNNSANWAFGLMIGFPIIILIPLIIVELILTIFSKKLSTKLTLLISLFSIPLVIFGTWEYLGWVGNIENIIIIPEDYKKDYLIIVYNTKTGKSIRPDFSLKRKRVLRFSNNGFFLTSTKLSSSSDQITNPKIFKSNGEEIKGKFYDNFFISNGFEQGYKYSIVNIGENIIHDMDSLFIADKIDFNMLDK